MKKMQIKRVYLIIFTLIFLINSAAPILAATCENITESNIFDFQCIIVNEILGSIWIFYFVAAILIIWFMASRRASGVIILTMIVVFFAIMVPFLPTTLTKFIVGFILVILLFFVIGRFTQRG